MTEITFSGHYSEEIFRRALLKHYRPLRLLAWFVLGSVILLDMAAPVYSETFSDVLVWWLSSLLLLIPAAYFLLLPNRQARVMARTPLAQSQVTGRVDERQLRMAGDVLNAKTPWSTYREYKFDDDLVLLYHGKNAFNIIPRNWFATTQDWETFLSIVQSNVVNQPTGKGVSRQWLFWLLALLTTLALLTIALSILLP